MINMMCVGGPYDGRKHIVYDIPHFKIARWKDDPFNPSMVMGVEDTYYRELLRVGDQTLTLWRHDSLKNTFDMLNHILQKYQQITLASTARVPVESGSSRG